MSAVRVLGVDLAGSEKRVTGVAYKEGVRVICSIVFGDGEIVEFAKPFTHIFVDAPLSLPMGRTRLEENNGIHFRECDLILKKMHIRFFPMTFGPMRILTQRAIRLKKVLEGLGKEVYEVFPGAFYDVMGVKRKDRRAIVEFYLNLGLELEQRRYSQDELDGIACLLTGCMFLEGKGVLLKGEDGCIVIPKHR